MTHTPRHAADGSLPTVYLRPSFWVGVTERAVKTVAQALLAVLAAAAVVQDVDWAAAAGTAALAGLLSVLTSLADPARADAAVATGEVRSGDAPTG